jgi:hypothetical protein
MSDKRSDLVNLVMDENVSAIQILVDRLEITSEEVMELIEELVDEGKLNGSLTEDGKRFFKSEVKLSDAPTIEREEKPPSFLQFNRKPGIITVVIGFIILAAGLIINSFAVEYAEQTLAGIVNFTGLIIIMGGFYWISLRKTPD